MNKKYFLPSAYINKVKQLVARALLGAGIELHITTKVGKHSVRFLVSSFIEYLLRAQDSYRREEVTMYWINNKIDNDDIVFDIGANIGAYSLLIGLNVTRGSGRVYAFEPESSNFHALNRNIRLNSLTKTVLPYAIAFGDKRRVSEFFLSSIIPGSALHGIDNPNSGGRHFEAKHIQGVYVMTVDDFVREHNVEFPNHIKIDVDGVEDQIIYGMKETLSDHRLQSIMVEIETVLSSGTVESFIEGKGFIESMREPIGETGSQFNVLYTRITNNSNHVLDETDSNNVETQD